MEYSSKKIKVGPITLALGLILGGVILLVYNFGVVDSLGWFWRLWPLLLVGLGVEYFVRKAMAKETDINFHVPSIILIVLLIFVSGAAAAVTGVSEKFGAFIDSGFLGSGHSEYNYSWTWNSDPVEVNNGEDELVISHQIGAISLLPSDDDRLQLSSVNRAKNENVRRVLTDNFHPEVTRDGRQLRIEVPQPQELEKGDIKIDLTVKVPAGMSVEASSELGKIACNDLDGDVKVITKLGALELDRIMGNVDAKTQGGEIKIFNPKGNVLAESDLGKVSLRSQEAVSGEYNLKSNLGNVTFRVPKESNLSVNASTDVGDINVSAPSAVDVITTRSGPSDEVRFQLGDGQGAAIIKVNTGSVDVSAQ